MVGTSNCGCHVTNEPVCIVHADLANLCPQGQIQQILHHKGLVRIFESGSPADSRITGRFPLSTKFRQDILFNVAFVDKLTISVALHSYRS